MQNEAFALLEHRVSSIEDSHVDLKDAIKELTDAIRKLAIIDERQIQSAIVMDKLTATVDKAHSRIDGLTSEFAKALEKASEENQRHRNAFDDRLRSLEKQEPLQSRATEWIDKVQWLIVGTVLTALLSFVIVNK